jgi:hypothetical protein
MQKIIKKLDLRNSDAAKNDLEFWLSRPPEERVSAVEILRRQYYGNTARLQRVVRVFQRQPR